MFVDGWLLGIVFFAAWVFGLALAGYLLVLEGEDDE